jgi:hypothetical protein
MEQNSDRQHSRRFPKALGWISMKSLILGVLLLAPSVLYAQQGQSEKPPSQKEQTEKTEKTKETEKTTPSLVDLARQERERRAQNQQPVRVISNKDLRSLGGGRVSTGVPPKPPAKSSEAEATSEGESGAQEEAPAEGGPESVQFWQSAFQEAKGSLETAVNQRMVLELRMNNLRNAYLNTDDGTTREKIQGELAQTYQALGQAREDESAARQAIDQLQRQASRAGLTPGQIRELVGELPDSKSIYEGVPASSEGAPES